MTLFERLHMPSLDGATEWLNSGPLGPAELRGHVVLANFWTLTCIQPAAPRAVRPRVVAGLPKRRVGRDRHPHAGVLARARHRWRAALDEGASDRLPGRCRQRVRDLERLRQPLLAGAVLRRRGRHHPRPPLRRRALRAIGAPDPAAARHAPTRSPIACASTTGPSPASGRSGARTSGSRGPAAASPTGFHARDAHLVLSPGHESRFPSRVLLDGEARARHTAWTSTRERRAQGRPPLPARASAKRSASGRWRSPSSSPAPRRTCSRSGNAPTPSKVLGLRVLSEPPVAISAGEHSAVVSALL